MKKLRDYFPNWSDKAISIWLNDLKTTESDYMNLINEGLKPQEARSVLSLDTATEARIRESLERDLKDTTKIIIAQRISSVINSDKIIVTTIQKLGIALDPHNRNNYQERLLPLKNKRMVFIFDECHRSQFGENHKAIKEFFPKAQLFGFTGTGFAHPI